MATISILSGPGGPLTPVTVSLPRGVQPQRAFYGMPEFMQGLKEDLPTWKCGRLKADNTPQEQFRMILERWISGRPMRYGTMFQDLMPRADQVWEMKQPDLRIFGWMYKPCVFIAGFIDYADWYKTPTKHKTYDGARKSVLNMRDGLGLDEPKYATGDYDDLV